MVNDSRLDVVMGLLEPDDGQDELGESGLSEAFELLSGQREMNPADLNLHRRQLGHE